MDTTLQPYYNKLESIYAPQRQLIQQQQAALPSQYDLQKQGLEQAKVNAFRDISSKARGMGVAFGGYSPSEQARYTGATYLPAIANLQANQTAGQTALQQALNSLNAEQLTKASGLYGSEQEALYNAQQKEADRQATIQAAQIKAAATAANKTSKFKATDVIDKELGTKKGTNFYGENGQPVTAAQYYSGVGGSIDDLYNFLNNDVDKTSKKAAAELAKAGEITSGLVAKYPWIFGG